MGSVGESAKMNTRISVIFTLFLITELGNSVPFHPSYDAIVSNGRYVKRSAMPGPLEFWLCASDFNPFNILIAQPMTKERCEVIPRAAPSSGADTGSAANMPIVQTFG